MKQQLKDLKLLLQKDRRAQVIAIIVGLSLIFLLFGEGNKPLKRARYAGTTPEARSSGATAQDEAYKDIVRALKGEMDEQNTALKDVATSVESLKVSTQDSEARTAEIIKRIVERMSETENQVAAATVGRAPQPVDLGEEGSIAPIEEEQDTLVSFGGETVQPLPPPQVEPKRQAVIGGGDSVRVKLLGGVNAPTDTTPYPTVFKLVSDVYGPDGDALPLGEARLIAAATGSLTDSRALFRITSLNIRLPNGKRKFVPVDGWVVGEDGVIGMEGVLIDPIGKGIAGGALAGGLDGLGRAVSSGQTTTYFGAYGSQEVVTGDDTKYAAGKAISGAARNWSSILRDRLSMLVPHVQVLSGREATAIFSEPIIIDDLYEALEEEEEVFATLD